MSLGVESIGMKGIRYKALPNWDFALGHRGFTARLSSEQASKHRLRCQILKRKS